MFFVRASGGRRKSTQLRRQTADRAIPEPDAQRLLVARLRADVGRLGATFELAKADILADDRVERYWLRRSLGFVVSSQGCETHVL
jgi:hypothetical protein